MSTLPESHNYLAIQTFIGKKIHAFASEIG